MLDNRVRLLAEIDYSQPVAGARQTEDAWARASTRMDRGFGTTAGNLRRLGTTLGATFGALAAHGAAVERSWTSVGISILAATAAGGKVGGLFALAGAAIGFLSRDTAKLDATTVKTIRALSGEISEVGRAVMDLEEAERASRGESVLGFQAEKAAANFTRLREQIAAANHALEGILKTEARMESTGKDSYLWNPLNLLAKIGPGKGPVTATLDGRSVGKGELKLLLEELNKSADDAAAKIAALRIADERTRITLATGFRNQIAVLSAGTESAKFLVALEQELEKLRVQGAQPDQLTALRSAAKGDYLRGLTKSYEEQARAIRDQSALLGTMTEQDRERLRINLEIDSAIRQIRRSMPEWITDEERAKVEALIQELEQFRKKQLSLIPLNDFATGLLAIRVGFGKELSGTISQALADGATTGFRNISQIGLSFLQTIGSQFLQLGVSAIVGTFGGGGQPASGLLKGLGSILGLAGGGEFVTSGGPALFKTSEHGHPELVAWDRHRTRVEPVRSGRASASGGGIIIQGPVTVQMRPGRSESEAKRNLLAALESIGRTRHGRAVLAGARR